MLAWAVDAGIFLSELCNRPIRGSCARLERPCGNDATDADRLSIVFRGHEVVNPAIEAIDRSATVLRDHGAPTSRGHSIWQCVSGELSDDRSHLVWRGCQH
jgi:hypothetical protein